MICQVCGNDCPEISRQSHNVTYNCKRCGIYVLPFGDIPRFNNSYRFMISGYIREHQDQKKPFHLTQDVVDRIQSTLPPTLDEKILKLMLWIKNKTSYPGEEIKLNLPVDSQELIAICYAHNYKEVEFFFDHLKERNFLSTNTIKLTVDGLQYLETERKRVDSDLCFCAMSFHEEHRYIYEQLIQPAVTKANYTIKRVDEDPHNDGIFDKVLSLIRKSKFVIADLTGNKAGVYYEAGFAKGLGKEVIFTCEENFFNKDKVHFDVQHLNLIIWNKESINDAIEKLKWRIEGTIDLGSF